MSLLFPIIMGFGYSQTYDFGAMTVVTLQAMQTIKLTGYIAIEDSLVVLHSDGYADFDYDIINKRNNSVNCTDGVVKLRMDFHDKQGKKKGFVYDKIVYFYFNELNPNSFSIYYLKERED